MSEVERAIAKLTKSHPQVISLQPAMLKEVWQDLERVAKILGVSAKGTLAKLQSRIKAISDRTEVLVTERPTVVSLEWTEPLMVGANWIPELIKIAGGEPLLSVKGENSSYLYWESLIDVDPEIIVIMPCGFDLERTAQESKILTKHPAWKTLRAVKNDQVFLTDGNAYFNRPGPRLVDSAEILAEIFHPELFDFGYKGTSWKPFV
jgi:iron complex transport system substrate-binding protein